jgi:RHS repeat-associated protein
MLSVVKRPDGRKVKFTYDPLGRRMSKSYNGRVTKWVWDGNVILHEWVDHFDDVNDEDEIQDSLQSDEISTASLQAQLDGRPSNGPPEIGGLPLPTTWLFDPDTFAPASKIVGDKHYSIITDHLGTPLSMFDETGAQTWGAELDVFGALKNLQGDRSDCPFRYPGQYEDGEIGLYYNRFRYYDPDGGEYVSQDPIGLEGCINLYAYVVDVNSWIDILGLNQKPESAIDWEKRFNLMAPGEKYNAALGKLHKVAKRNGWVQDNRLTRLNNRVVYSDTNGKYYAFDTQHGRFEYLDNRGRHLGEFDIDGKLTKPADASGKHNIRCG